MMRLKPTIVSLLPREDLRTILDELEIEGPDRRKPDAMRAALQRSRRVSAEVLLGYLRKAQVQEVCRAVGVEAGGRKEGG